MKPQIIDRYVYVKGKKISEVDNKTVLDGTERVPLAQNDMNYSTTVDTISNYVDSVHDYLTTEDYNDLKSQVDSERTNRQEADNELNQSIQDTKSELHSTISNVKSELLNEVSDLQGQIDNINNTGIANGVTLDTVQTITGEKTFTTVPKSTASATSANDLTNKNYVDTAISEALGDTISDVVTTNTAQEISGLKTFKTLPKGDGTPTASNDLVTKQYVDNAVSNADIDLDGYATQTWVNEQGFAKTSDLPEGIEIGETTGTAFDGGKGKELEDTVATMEEQLSNAVLFKFDTYDLKFKNNSFLISFLLQLIDSSGATNNPIILQYGHSYDLNADTNIPLDEQISSIVTVAVRNLDSSSGIAAFILYSNVYYSKANNRDQLIKIDAFFNFADEQNIQADFKVEEVPVDLSGTVSYDSFYVFPENKLVNGAVLTEEEHKDLWEAVRKRKIALFKNDFMSLSTRLDSSSIYFTVNTSFINKEGTSSYKDYSHAFLYLDGRIDSGGTVRISDQYNKEGSLCYVYGQDRDIVFIPITTFQQGIGELSKAFYMANIPMFLDYFESEDGSSTPSGALNIASLQQVDTDQLISSNLIYTSEDAINIVAQSRYMVEAGESLIISKTILKPISLILSGDGTKFLSDNGTYKTITQPDLSNYLTTADKTELETEIEDLNERVSSSKVTTNDISGGLNITSITQSAYNELQDKDANTLYIITE